MKFKTGDKLIIEVEALQRDHGCEFVHVEIPKPSTSDLNPLPYARPPVRFYLHRSQIKGVKVDG